MRWSTSLLLILCCASAPGQAPPQSAIPSDATEYLTMTFNRMMQREKGTLPFHLKAHFIAQGSAESTGSGSYEETWVSPEKWRKEITLGNYRLVVVKKENSIYRLTPVVYEPMVIEELQDIVLPSIPSEDKSLDLQRTMIGDVEVIRIGKGTMKGNKIAIPDDARYFSADRNVMLAWTRGYEVVLFTRTGKLGDKTVLLDCKVNESGKTLLDFDIDELTANPSLDESIFAVPDSAQAICLEGLRNLSPEELRLLETPNKSVKSAAVARCLSCPQPRYPDEAKQRRIEGVVVIGLQIDQEGKVRESRVISSPDITLSKAAIQTVSTWRYSPILINGVPTQAITQVHVNFTMGH